MKNILNLLDVIGAIIWNGYVFSLLWLWFVVSTFGAPVLSLATAVGLFMTVRFLVVKRVTDNADNDAGDIAMWVYPTVALVVGFVVKLFM